MNLYDKYMEWGSVTDELMMELSELTDLQYKQLVDTYDRRGVSRRLKYGEVTHEELWLLHMPSAAWVNIRHYLGFEFARTDIAVLFDDRVNEEVLVMYHMGNDRVDDFMDLIKSNEEDDSDE